MSAQLEDKSRIYRMHLLESIHVSEFVLITRVPGGWIYEIKATGGPDVVLPAVAFIPYRSEL